ncbi:MAG: Na/Pi cotransporter family protein [Oscillospiraceae bacterium]|nr:Na/Pi cotransporter family protein [Oscillospiraceae bacterium]
MTVSDALALCGGLGLFLFGMHMMSDGLEAAAGEKMKQLMEKLTSSTFKGIVVGTFITALIQSSSATTVMLVGFVNSGLMNLANTVGIIMGANIGATMNGVLLAVGVGELAPAIEFIGVCLIMFSKNEKIKQTGNIITGLGVLFLGMNMMSGAMAGLRQSEAFINLITTFRNPLIGVLVGTVFTAVIQSSSATVGILESLALAGLITLDSGIYVMFGATIGTCITAAIASIGTSTNAKRVAVIHLVFNIIGTVIFVAGCQVFPFVEMVEHMFPGAPSVQIANAHVIFKIVTTVILFPFAKQLVTISQRVIRDKEEENRRPGIRERAKKVAGYSVGSSAISISLIREEIDYMYALAGKNTALGFESIIHRTDEYLEDMRANEDELDRLNGEISRYISGVIVNKMPAKDSAVISSYFRMISNIERIGDHAMNFADSAKFLISKGERFSDRAIGEMQKLQEITMSAIGKITDRKENTSSMLSSIARAEQKMDDMTEEYRTAQMERLRTTTCSPEASIVYAQLLTDFERIGDHLLNIAEEYVKINPAKPD